MAPGRRKALPKAEIRRRLQQSQRDKERNAEARDTRSHHAAPPGPSANAAAPVRRVRTQGAVLARRALRALVEANENANCDIVDVKENNFAMEVPLTPHTMYMSRGNTGSVTTKSELGIQVVDFFDYGVLDSAAGGIPQDVTNYFWNINQNLFDNAPTATSDKTATFCRVRRLQVYVLPLKGFNLTEQNAPNDSNADAMFTVNAQVPGVSLTQGSTFSPAVAADTQVTNILPQFDTFWKKVLSCDLDKTFSSGVMRPFFNEGTQRTDQCLFQMSIRDPVTGLPYLPADEVENPLAIRVKVVLHIDQPIAPTQNAELRVFRNEDFSRPSSAQNGSPYTAATAQYVQMNLTGRLDKFR